MAGEITVNIAGTISIGTAPYNVSGEAFPTQQLSFDSSTSLSDKVIRSCTTSDVSLTALLPNTDNIEGLMYMKNLDNTNYIVIGPDSGGAIIPFARINPGRAMIVPLYPTVTLRIQANTASVKAEFRVFAGNSTSGA